ncbi:MAG: hypothetical protein CME70_03575 [Halobacteriovorax sp.]|nr:hypothetical protein [Halobacteriovorax sp.]|tara:strand:- start:207708 stop:208583 length:876 start_codon:yes stop_codon:yes gene_type:complete
MKVYWLIFLFLTSGLEASEVFDKLASLNGLSTHQKIYYWTEQFLGLPYGKGGPLGEGKKGQFDQDPLYRFDTFDCTTFVETVTALSLSSNKSEFENHLLELRYKNAKISYTSRKHITSQSWIPENTNNGYYLESTPDFPVKFQDVASAQIDLPSWYKAHNLSRLRLPELSNRKKRKRVKQLQSLGENFDIENVELPYLVIKDLLNDWEGFQENLNGVYIINIVRPNWNMKYKVGTNLLVSHQGFLLKKNGVPTMIHASTTGEVVEVSLKKYLGWFKNSSSVKGINLLQVIQ